MSWTDHTWLKWLMDAVFLMQVGALVRAFWDYSLRFPVTSTLGGLVYALPHLLPGSEKREALLPHFEECSGSGITAGSSRSVFDQKDPKPLSSTRSPRAIAVVISSRMALTTFSPSRR